ncbi:hypothetical protein AX774_g6369 [Zancudomyces culisetae]|uniref:Uncharacterized protein n=1 Tax=Zancudomyces culisetae TaxID=1213189 RepID=A0A1R1PGZ7_ZANCU|nr:hypothetical protein AX774_g6369 [Zancudomyces culisetae]|eukprot:OMH80199.1 hypothetical protein AX774_g6369 [Zancudomyces culisetae]
MVKSTLALLAAVVSMFPVNAKFQTLHAKIFSGYRFSGAVVDELQMVKHQCYNINPGRSGQYLNPTDGSGALIMCRERNCQGVCTANTDFIRTGNWDFYLDVGTSVLSMKWIAFGLAANE